MANKAQPNHHNLRIEDKLIMLPRSAECLKTLHTVLLDKAINDCQGIVVLAGRPFPINGEKNLFLAGTYYHNCYQHRYIFWINPKITICPLCHNSSHITIFLFKLFNSKPNNLTRWMVFSIPWPTH